uniref:Uncharacterized protein n=1 Tax=uncultured marine virus TaxID=186617 RepID=A0A0F7L2Y5_9VIRU|nr:hypothetical protein [uncultured marine virus]
MSESNELIVIEEVKAVEVFTSNGIKPLIKMVREKALSEVPDMSNKKGARPRALFGCKGSKNKNRTRWPRKRPNRGLEKASQGC